MSCFRDKTVLITGGSSGIGLATAHRLHEEGARLILLARDQEKLARAACEVGKGVKHFSADVADIQALRKVTEALAEPVDILINNAGITRPGNFLELPEECFQQMLDVNYLGAVNLTRLILPSMLERGGGRLVFVSSLLGLMGVWGYSAYSASKFAIRGFAECLRTEFKPRGIEVTICYPPDTDTPQHEFEKPLLPPETVAQAGTAGLLSADYVAEQLVQGISKGKFHVVPGTQAKFIDVANRLVPSVVHAFIDRDARQARPD